MATERVWDMMMRMSMPYGSTGLTSYAISAVDLAMWDLKGKILKTPVYELAGSHGADHAKVVEVTCSIAEPEPLRAAASGPRRRAAEQDAAEIVLGQLTEPLPPA